MVREAHPDDVADVATENVATHQVATQVDGSDTVAGHMESWADDVRPGQTIGRFIVQEQLGAGGMGVVLSALDPELNRHVAIKLVRVGDDQTASRGVMARLRREAQAMARFRHPNILSVFEVGEHEGQVFVAMEQVDGGTLRDVVQRMRSSGSASWRQILSLFAKAGSGLAAAHEAGMVHRDFKPDNVLVDGKKRVLVSDFGIVSQAGAPGSPSAGLDELFADSLTQDNFVVGTPAYMAPEQHLGHTVDARADQYSFCVALYEAIYGHLPFAGDSFFSYLEAVRTGTVRPAPAASGVPAWLHRVLVRGLSPNPSDRFENMKELLNELGADPERSRILGSSERMVFAGGVAAFVLAWMMAVAGFDVELSYGLHYATDLGFLGMTLALAWIARHEIRRSNFNRQAFYLVFAIAVSLVVLIIGGHQLGMSPQVIGAFHMLVIGACCLVGLIPFGVIVVPMALGYLGGFIIASAYPATFFPVLLASHTLGAVTTVVIARARTRETAADASAHSL